MEKDECFIDGYGGVYSSDRKTLYKLPENISLNDYQIVHGTETIGTKCDYNTDIDRITLPSTVRVIESYAFCGDNISSVQLNEGLLYIGDCGLIGAVYDDKFEVVLPKTLRFLGINPFTQEFVYPKVKSKSPYFKNKDGFLISEAGSVVCYLNGYIESKIPTSFNGGIAVEHIRTHAFKYCTCWNLELHPGWHSFDRTAFFSCNLGDIFVKWNCLNYKDRIFDFFHNFDNIFLHTDIFKVIIDKEYIPLLKSWFGENWKFKLFGSRLIVEES